MAGHRKWFYEKLLKPEKPTSIEDEWQFDPAPSKHITDPNAIGPKQALVSFEPDETDLLESHSFNQDAVDPSISHSFSGEKVSRSKAWQFYLEGKIFDIQDSVRVALTKEYELGNQFNFAPVVLALGIGAYYYAGSEPLLAPLLGTLAILAVVLFKQNIRGLAFGLCAIALLFVAGLAAAKIQMDRAVMPVPMSQITGQIKGVVQLVDQNRRGVARYLIRPLAIEGLAPDELPNSIRLSASKKHTALVPGDGIEGLARMQPISGPAYPGSYDFAFASYLQGLGMSGFFMGAPSTLEAKANPDWLMAAKLKLQNARGAISERIRSGLPGEAGDIATALITGDRSGLSNETQESLRRSGLAHILAISGLHMALVTLTIIWLVRVLLVLIPRLADNYPIKKWAIAAGFITATLYLFISGASIATQRAWLMITVMLAASFMDRRALTMRSVTIAALVILILSPASLFQPGFQMSFAAVAALVAIYQDWTRISRNRRSLYYEPKTGWIRQLSRYFAGLSATSLIAGFATALIAMAHFHRVAPMGLISNLVAMPIVSMLVMPLSLFSMFLMPYGFEGLALAPLGSAILGVVSVADWVNSYEFDFETGHRPSYFLAFSAGFLVLGCFLRTRLRLLAIAPILGLTAMASKAPDLPDMLIGQDGRSIAVRTSLLNGKVSAEDGLTLLYPRSGKFTTEIWQKAFLPNRKFDSMSNGLECSKDRCDFLMSNMNVKVIFDPKLLKDACKTADLLLAPRLWWVNCIGKKPRLIITRTDLEKNGSHQLHLSGDTIAIKTAWPNADAHEKRRIWHERFDIISRRYPARIETSLGPPRRRGGLSAEIDLPFE